MTPDPPEVVVISGFFEVVDGRSGTSVPQTNRSVMGQMVTVRVVVTTTVVSASPPCLMDAKALRI